MTRSFVVGAMILCSLAWITGSAAAANAPIVEVHHGDAGTTVYDWSAEHCEDWDTPDAPLRAFRDANGGVVAFVSDSDSRIFRGKSLLTLHHSCHSTFLSRKNADPAAYADLGYVTATWTDDGNTIAALIHDEYHAEQFPGACLFKDSMPCWYTTIVGARSTDGGMNFRTADPPVPVAAAPFRQDFEQGRHRGFFNPSNIFFHDGFYYMATDTTGGLGQREGLCLFRTRTVHDPASWRGFDGRGYTSQALDPYRVDTRHYVPCEPVDGPGTVGSISWYPAAKMFLLVFQEVDSSRPDGYTAYVWSDDLIHWSKPAVLYDHPNMSSNSCSDRFRFGYPSIADPDAPGRNFDGIGDHPVLFLTRFHVAGCNLPPNRDLVRFQLDIRRP
jgi:hypothetical protein